MDICGRDFSDHLTTQADRVWMDRMVHELQQHLPRMLMKHPQRDEFWNWFCGEADSLFRYIHRDEDRRYFLDVLNKTLEEAGLEERFDLGPRAGQGACAHRTAGKPDGWVLTHPPAISRR